jgi:hypothetical protein
MRTVELAILTFATGLLGSCASNRASLLDYTNAYLAQAGLPTLSPAEFERQQVEKKQREERYEAVRLRNAGFAPAAELRRAGRTLVRATYAEPRLFIRMPGVTFEQMKDGQVAVSLTSDGRAKTGSALIPAAQWEVLRKSEAAAFAPDPPKLPTSWKKGDPVPRAPQSVCHAWGATIERISPAKTERVEAHGCYATPLIRARLEYAMQLAKVALDAIPGCQEHAKREGDPLDNLARCFGTFDPATTRNP